MHEMGTVLAVLDTADKIIEENGLSSIESITLEVGEVSGILPEFLYKCWGFAVTRSKYAHDAELIIEMLPAVTACNDCGKEYETVTYGRTCPYCSSGNTVLICGNEYNIKEITAASQ